METYLEIILKLKKENRRLEHEKIKAGRMAKTTVCKNINEQIQKNNKLIKYFITETADFVANQSEDLRDFIQKHYFDEVTLKVYFDQHVNMNQSTIIKRVSRESDYWIREHSFGKNCTDQQ